MVENLRVEISFRDFEQLKKKIDFCLINNINKINIPCKGIIKKNFLLEVVKYIGTNYRSLDVVYHYSFYYEYYKNKTLSYDKFLNFLEINKNYNNKEILLVSGSKKRKNFDVLNILDYLKSDLSEDLKFGIAYNPYYSDHKNHKDERDRLIYKINSGLINSIWLQFGSDLHNLNREIKFLKEIKNNFFISRNKQINIYGSLFIPSKQFLARFKFRPWRGVFLSNDYLDSIEISHKITKEIINTYSVNNIFPLIESDCTSEKQIKEARKFINL